MSLVCSFVEEIADGSAVGDHHSLEFPFVAENVHQKCVTAAARLTVKAVVCSHNLLDIGLGHEGLESRKICLPKVSE